jgi:signal transduction histidine kinase
VPAAAGSNVFDIAAILDRRREHWVLAMMLLALHATVVAGAGSGVAASLMTTHLGLFFLWQPIWRRDERLDWTTALIIVLFTAGCAIALGWLVLFAWVVLLIGIVAGRSLDTRKERYAYMVTLAVLIAELLIGIVPHAFAIIALNTSVERVFKIVLTAAPLALLLLPPVTAPRATFPIEFFRGIIIALITALLALGSVVLSYQRAVDYPTALVIALIAVAGFLLFLAWLIAPDTRSGLGSLWEKSVLNIGTPFEAWISRLAELAAREGSQDALYAAALEELLGMPWVAGIRSADGALRGRQTDHQAHLASGPVDITLYAERPIGPALRHHSRLLIEILGQFCIAKRREVEQAHQAQLKAIYETGARVTHDIKNLLQSLKIMAAPVAPGDPRREEEQLRRLRRQLPQVVQRLQVALDKLQQPATPSPTQRSLAAWWQQLCARCEGQGIEMSARLSNPALPVPDECLDSVVENLLDNARQKRQLEPGLRVSVTLQNRGDRYRVDVADDGHAVPADIAATLFHQTVSSANGLGVGLYQAYQLAERSGLELRLAENRDGVVRFQLSQGDATYADPLAGADAADAEAGADRARS